jgi:hypothetical protein
LGLIANGGRRSSEQAAWAVARDLWPPADSQQASLILSFQILSFQILSFQIR